MGWFLLFSCCWPLTCAYSGSLLGENIFSWSLYSPFYPWFASSQIAHIPSLIRLSFNWAVFEAIYFTPLIIVDSEKGDFLYYHLKIIIWRNSDQYCARRIFYPKSEAFKMAADFAALTHGIPMTGSTLRQGEGEIIYDFAAWIENTEWLWLISGNDLGNKLWYNMKISKIFKKAIRGYGPWLGINIQLKR